jgi:hypothetical protein
MRELEIIAKLSQNFTRDISSVNYNRINADKLIFAKLGDKALITFKGISGQILKWYVALIKGELTILHGDSPRLFIEIYRTKFADKNSKLSF